MNYLAHAYFSFNHSEVLVGNMISDFVKGKQQFLYPPNIQKGIQLHRAIDNFTDTHNTIKQAKELFKPQIGLYAGAFVDIALDYFLANDKNIFPSDNQLNSFAQNVYETLNTNHIHLPENFATILPFMQQHNWLYFYKDASGIAKSFSGTTRRASYINPTHTAFDIFIAENNTLQQMYDNFIIDLKKYTLHKFEELFTDFK